jgi:hypothetical protein
LTRSSALSAALAGGAHSVAVTGASGWFGLTALELLRDALGADAFRERVRAYASASKTLRLRDGEPVPARALADLEPADLVLHFAYLTRERCG